MKLGLAFSAAGPTEIVIVPGAEVGPVVWPSTAADLPRPNDPPTRKDAGPAVVLGVVGPVVAAVVVVPRINMAW